MDRHFLEPLFDPRRILALVPAGQLTGALVQQLAGTNIPCEIVEFDAEHPHLSISASVDLALIDLPQDAIAAALEECGRIHVRAAVLLPQADSSSASARSTTSGTSSLVSSAHPIGAAPANENWRTIAMRYGIHLLGPQTLGIQRPHIGLNASQLGPLARAGNLALVAQSGALAASILDWAAGTSIGFSAVVAVGADSGIDVSHALNFLATDFRTQSILLYVEGIADARSFLSALRSAASAKPVLVLKGGARPEGRHAALTHSGAMVGENAVFNAALRRAGAVRVRFFTQLFAAARCVASRYRPCGPRLAILTNGGGPAVLAADWAGESGVQIASISAAGAAALGAVLPAEAVLSNPVDLGEHATPEQYAAALQALAEDKNVDGVLVMCSPKLGIDANAIAQTVAQVGKSINKPVLACWMGDRTMSEPRRLLDESGMPAFRTPEAAVDSFANIAAYHHNQQLLQQSPPSLSGVMAPDLEGARIIIETALSERRNVLSEMESKSLLASFGIAVTSTMLARTTTEALIISAQIGYPVALKVSSPDIAHKSDVQGVALNVRNAGEVRNRFTEILASSKEARPDARIDGVTIQEMSKKPNGRELYVGVARDALFGPVITFGAGGTLVEIIRDRALDLPPLNRFLARQLIERTRVAKTLDGGRGMPPIDMAALEDLLVRVSDMVCELPWLTEMDINPIIVDEHGAIAVDARIVVEHAPPLGLGRHSHMAILPYPSHFEEEVPLPDGHTYRIRPIRPEDAEHLQTMMRALSDETRYFRFFSMVREHSPRTLARFTQVDYFREMALIAVSDEQLGNRIGERIVGVARYVLNPDGESAEFAVVVADDWAGRGLGSRLMNSICEVARSKGIRRIVGHVLGQNSNMLALMGRLGFSVRTDPSDGELRIVEKAL